MSNWFELSSKEDKELYKKIYKKLKFKPSTVEFPSFVVPSPFISYDLSHCLVDMSQFESLNSDLKNKTLHNLKEVTKKDEFIYGFDWNHASYWVNPHLDFPKTECNEWLVPVFPDGDYYFFLQENLDWGILGHPWEKSITIFGTDLLKAFKNVSPSLFWKVLRKG
ncbi:DUF2716 domain-containing protein [Metabacillus indicus]|uniref:DUF2716 domain-containing protein n=1 Tax=Metabacillus indicus TaxID=246786 RepID=UPI0039841BB5